MKLGLIVNPVAGLGGTVGLKGTDGMAREALALGAVPKSGLRTLEALKMLESLREDLVIYTASGEMGEAVVRELGFACRVLWHSEKERVTDVDKDTTSREDTRQAAKKILEEGVSLLLFAGGDGTARDVYEAVGESLPVAGIPTGVKIHSPVYAVSPEKAGELARRFLRCEITGLKTEEVLDIDEAAYRQGHVETKLYGYLKVPDDARLMQGRKSGSLLSDESAQKAIALRVVDGMVPEMVYVIGPGSTTRQVMAALDLPATLLGVDIVCNRQLVCSDATEKNILAAISGKESRLVITPIGGQGYLFGRGNQQLSAGVIHQTGPENLMVMATLSKIQALQGRPLMVDTGDPALDRELEGYYQVMTGYRESIMYKVITS